MTTTLDRLKEIRIVVLDVDGVLTDGSLVFTDKGELAKSSMSATASASSFCRPPALKLQSLRAARQGSSPTAPTNSE